MKINTERIFQILKTKNVSRSFQDIVIEEAYKAKKITGLPASIVASQAILETGWGKYVPKDIDTGKYSYNLFGIKGLGTNGFVRCWTTEYENGQIVKITDRFRAYRNYEESFIDYGKLILGNPRYQKAVAVKNDPRKYIEEIWKAGYCTDPDYPRKVIQIAEQCGYIKKI